MGGRWIAAALGVALMGGAAHAHAQDAGVPAPPPADATPDAGPPEQAPEEPEEAPDAEEPEEAPDAEERPTPRTPPQLTPPRILRSTPPPYPAGRIADGLHPSVVLIVTLDEDGEVVDTHVEHSAEPEFDRAAVDAIRSWTFAPAERDGVPIPSRIRVAVHFELPSFDVATPAETVPAVEHEDHDDAQPAPQEPPAATEPEPAPEDEPGVTADVEAAGLRDEDRGASHFDVERDVIAAAPRQEGADVMLSVPGVFVSRAEGLAVGHRINLRGFDAEHGQDIELRIGGLPVNLPSHIHGQGYADLGFLIPEVVQRLNATEGVSDPRQGDFAVAGSVDFTLGVSERDRGWRIESGYGNFNTFRQLVLWAPEGERDETFGAVQYRHTDGFGENRGGDSASAIVQAGGRDGSWRFRGLGVLYGARADLAGVVRVADVDAGRVGFYDSYDAPTADSQNALSGRFVGGFFGDYRGASGDNGGFSVWLGADTFRLQENFTGFIQRSRTLADTAGRGDLIEQQNQTLSAGVSGRYRTEQWRPFEWAGARLEVGLDGRMDFIEQAQNLLGVPRNQTWDRRVDAAITGANIGLWGDVELALSDYVTLHVGVRAALLLYDIDDRLGNFVPAVRPDDAFIMGFRRSAGGAFVGPRASAEVRPIEWLKLRASYGQGYRSPQARTLEDGERAPFTTVHSADLGARFEVESYLQVTVAGYWTELSDDVAFEAREGRLERVGASRRLGAVLHAQARPVEWLVGAASVTYVDAELLEPPPPSAEDPQPAFEPGQNLPYVPPVVIRADVGAHGTLLDDVLGQELRGRVGVGYSFLSPRPLPFGGSADPISLLDASAGLGWGPVDLGVSFYNLFDTRWAASEFLFTSNWDPAGVPSRVPARHRSAGAPFTFMVTLGVSP